MFLPIVLLVLAVVVALVLWLMVHRAQKSERPNRQQSYGPTSRQGTSNPIGFEAIAADDGSGPIFCDHVRVDQRSGHDSKHSAHDSHTSATSHATHDVGGHAIGGHDAAGHDFGGHD